MSALACTVFTAQCVNLTRIQRKGDILKSFYAREGLTDIFQFQHSVKGFAVNYFVVSRGSVSRIGQP